MWCQVNDHCLTCNLQPDYQSMYRANYSCETCLLCLCNDVLWAFEWKSITALTALDLSAAIDTVDLLRSITDT